MIFNLGLKCRRSTTAMRYNKYRHTVSLLLVQVITHILICFGHDLHKIGRTLLSKMKCHQHLITFKWYRMTCVISMSSNDFVCTRTYCMLVNVFCHNVTHFPLHRNTLKKLSICISDNMRMYYVTVHK